MDKGSGLICRHGVRGPSTSSEVDRLIVGAVFVVTAIASHDKFDCAFGLLGRYEVNDWLCRRGRLVIHYVSVSIFDRGDFVELLLEAGERRLSHGRRREALLYLGTAADEFLLGLNLHGCGGGAFGEFDGVESTFLELLQRIDALILGLHKDNLLVADGAEVRVLIVVRALS